VRDGEGGKLMVTITVSRLHHELFALTHSISEALGCFGFAHEVLAA
jgi:hypothetical protein